MGSLLDYSRGESSWEFLTWSHRGESTRVFARESSQGVFTWSYCGESSRVFLREVFIGRESSRGAVMGSLLESLRGSLPGDYSR